MYSKSGINLYVLPFLPEKSHGQRSLEGSRLSGCKESETE